MCMKKTSLAILSVLLLASCGNKSEQKDEQQPDVYPTEVLSKQKTRH